MCKKCKKQKVYIRNRSVEEALKKYTVDSNGCHNMITSKDKDGYSRIATNRGYVHYDIKKHTGKAHRVKWEQETGDLLAPTDVIMHICDNPGCINFDHLRKGTQYDNIHDMINKHRGHWQ